MIHQLSLLLAQDTGVEQEGGAFGTIAMLAILVLLIAGFWKVFQKAGQPGWAALIPIYNLYVLLKVVGRPGWWLLLYLIPLVNFIVMIVVWNDLARVFGKGIGYTLGLIFLGFIFVPLLGFGNTRYQPGNARALKVD